MQCLVAGLSPGLRSCLICPILLDDPAASSRAETDCSMLSPDPDDLRHDAHGDLLRRHRADGDTHGDDDTVDVLPGKTAFRQGVHEQALLAPAPEQPQVPGIGPE